MLITGKFGFDVYDERGVLLAHREFFNGITQTAIHDLWDTYFSDGVVASAWYIGLIDNSGFTAVDNVNDTMSSHTGWTEITTEYDEATRPPWAPDDAASQTKANATKAIFTINDAINVQGLFITSDNTKGGTGGLLWCTGILDIVQQMQPGQTVKAYYSLLGQEG